MKNNGRLNQTDIFCSRGLNALELEIKEIGNLCSFFLITMVILIYNRMNVTPILYLHTMIQPL